jgi:hypothetical protein
MAATLIFLASVACFCGKRWIIGTMTLVVALLVVL